MLGQALSQITYGQEGQGAKAAFEQGPEGSEGVSHALTWGLGVPRGVSSGGTKARMCCHVC